MKQGAPGSFGVQLKALREAAGFTQEELATIAGLSVHAVSALERGERRRPHVDTVRALSAALDLTGAARDALLRSAREPAHDAAVDELSASPLPLPLTALLGRENDLQALGRWLADPTARLITLVGPGGVGKTRMALALARAVADEGRATRVVFVELAPVADAAFVGAAIAEALGLSDVTALDLPKRVRAASEDQPILLVLDNCEHVLDAAPLVAELLTSAPALRLVATSRAPLRVRGEREYALGPLALGADVDVTSPADLARAPAVRLFLERVRDVQPDFRLTTANGPILAAICQRLDALPLALELAAPWMKALAAEDLLRELDRDVLLSTVGPRDLPKRQQTMNAAVAWSYQLLSPEEQRAFRRLGVLPARFPIEAAAAVLAGRQATTASSDALTVAAGLIDKSLLLRSETSRASRPLYQMLETVRAYALLKVNAAAEYDDAMEGLARYCLDESTSAADGLVAPAQIEWLGRVRDNLETYRSALSWLIEHDRAADAANIAWRLLFFWLIRGRAGEGIRWLERTLSATLPPAEGSRALTGSAVLFYTLGDLGRARTAIAGALALARDGGDHDIIPTANIMLGHVEHLEGNLHLARDRFADSIDGFRALKSPWGVGNALSGLAWVALAADDATQAARLLDESAAALQEAGPWFLELGLYVRAMLAVRRGEADVAIALMRESLARIRELHDKFAFVHALVPLAAAAVLKGHDGWAARILGARDVVEERTGAMVVDQVAHVVRADAEREARARLGPSRWASAYAAGRSASIDSLLSDIDNKIR